MAAVVSTNAPESGRPRKPVAQLPRFEIGGDVVQNAGEVAFAPDDELAHGEVDRHPGAVLAYRFEFPPGADNPRFARAKIAVDVLLVVRAVRFPA